VTKLKILVVKLLVLTVSRRRINLLNSIRRINLLNSIRVMVTHLILLVVHHNNRIFLLIRHHLVVLLLRLIHRDNLQNKQVVLLFLIRLQLHRDNLHRDNLNLGVIILFLM
jgi:hypothetical protein